MCIRDREGFVEGQMRHSLAPKSTVSKQTDKPPFRNSVTCSRENHVQASGKQPIVLSRHKDGRENRSFAMESGARYSSSSVCQLDYEAAGSRYADAI